MITGSWPGPLTDTFEADRAFVLELLLVIDFVSSIVDKPAFTLSLVEEDRSIMKAHFDWHLLQSSFAFDFLIACCSGCAFRFG